MHYDSGISSSLFSYQYYFFLLILSFFWLLIILSSYFVCKAFSPINNTFQTFSRYIITKFTNASRYLTLIILLASNYWMREKLIYVWKFWNKQNNLDKPRLLCWRSIYSVGFHRVIWQHRVGSIEKQEKTWVLQLNAYFIRWFKRLIQMVQVQQSISLDSTIQRKQTKTKI